MIYITLPVGSYHGWGVCGKYLVKELSLTTEVMLISEPIDPSSIGNESDYRLIKEKMMPDDEYQRIKTLSELNLEGPVLHAIISNTMKSTHPNIRGSRNVGYTFFEESIIPSPFIENGKRFFDIIVTGSTWCEEVLRDYGINNVATIIQGIDPAIFNSKSPVKEHFTDLFVIFSGGKFELRKGQDIVIKAFKHMQDKYPDVILVNSWFNHWNESLSTMKASQHIEFDIYSDDYTTLIKETLVRNGVNLQRAFILPPYPNVLMAEAYRNSDIGLFPNRCEGGTNLVLMEYMACGKPVIASFNTGHKDVLNKKNSILIEDMEQISIYDDNREIASWFEPSLDETIAKLEWAYKNRAILPKIGELAGQDMAKATWRKTAQDFYTILTS
ncbi:MAG: glycosyltransferase family 4 protein [Nitrospirae bacterium]|nr:glycosyltransferase family 4 protein [Nitrospirota bacterium]